MKKIFTIFGLFAILGLSGVLNAQTIVNAKLSNFLTGNPDEDESSMEWISSIGKCTASSTLSTQGNSKYNTSNISDMNINTAWVEGETEYGIGVKLTFEMNFTGSFPNDPNAKFGGVYQIYGEFMIANGYCKSDQSWKDNSRVKQLKVYLGLQPLCIVNLLDTKKWQEFDLSKILKNKNVKSGDKLIFEITDVFKGSKYKDTAISELVGKIMSN